MGVQKGQSKSSRERELEAQVARLQDEIGQLKHNLSVFARIIFGRSSEKRKLTGLAVGNPHQLHLFMPDLVADAERASEESEAVGHVEVAMPKAMNPRKKKGRRKKFPEEAPQVETVYELSESDRTCDCGAELHQIGFETTRQLEHVEVTVVHAIKRAKYGCRECEETMITAPGPVRGNKKELLAPGFQAHVINEHFQHHMPYYRQEKKYAQEGLEISRSVLERTASRCGKLLAPLHDALKEEVLSQEILFTDDTPVNTVGKAGAKEGRIWVYLSKGGHHYYDFTESRKREGPASILNGYKGFIQADAYSGYDQLFGEDGATEVACWAHARRKFETAKNSDPTLGGEALDLIGKLYEVEKVAKEAELKPAEVLVLRTKYAGAILEEIKAWLALNYARVLPKSPMGKAITYAQNQWDALNVYLTDGRLEIDNNAAERGMRPIAVGRKNWLFFQSVGGGKTAAVLMSLIQTAVAAGVNVKLYLRDVLMRIAVEKDVTKLLPHAWKEHFEPEVLGRRNEILELLIQSRQER